MQDFLEKCAHYLLDKFREPGNICLIFPNRRAGLFFKKHLGNLITEPTWLPDIFSIEDFIFRISNHNKVDHIDLLVELFQIHQEIEKGKSDTFEDFLKWGSLLLSDFNEIDAYCVDPKSIFSFLNEVKAISTWNLDKSPLTEYEKGYLAFYNNLLDYHNRLTNALLNKNQAYQGLAYRLVSENIDQVLSQLTWQNIVFIGFNALNKAEENIIKTLIKADKADILWDADSYYLKKSETNQPVQEAGKFLFKHFQDSLFNKPNWIDDNLTTGAKNIEIIGVASDVGQTKLCGQILSDFLKNEREFENTAVILGEEKLLIPQLNSIPEDVGSLNVTMGLPLYLSTAFRFFDRVLRFYVNADRLNNLRKSDSLLYNIKDVEEIINHPLVGGRQSIFTDKTQKGALIIAERISRPGKTFYSSTALLDLFVPVDEHNFFTILFTDTGTPLALIKKIKQIIILIRNVLSSEIKTDNRIAQIEIEYLYYFNRILNKLETLTGEDKVIKTLESLRAVFNSISRSTSIPFYGEPLKGLQLMGMLETRTLDFKNIILLSVNEDIIPASKKISSFIPLDVKVKFGLPTYYERDAIYAYHFYRLLQRSQKIFLLYTTEHKGTGSGDRSRFINQLVYELAAVNPDLQIRENFLYYNSEYSSSSKNIVIDKTKEIIALLHQKAADGYSATELNAYRICSLKFYFNSIAGISEARKSEGIIDAPMFGTILHEVLHRIFEPMIGKALNMQQLAHGKKNIRKITLEVINNRFGGDNLQFGRNLLISETAISVAERFISSEIAQQKYDQIRNSYRQILDLEKKFEQIIRIENGKNAKGTIDVKLKGIIDRIESSDSQLRITDYKTGSANQSDLTLKSWEDLLSVSRWDKVFQLLFYALLVEGEFSGKYSAFNAGIYSLRTPGEGLIELKLPDQTELINPGIDIFREKMSFLLEELFDQDIPFKQTVNQDICNLCSYKLICNR